MIFEIWQEESKLDSTKVKKYNGWMSRHRNNKLGVHTTVGGKGRIARLFAKIKKKKRK